MSLPSGVLAPPPLPSPKAGESKLRTSLFARFMNGLRESRLQEARVIERHSHLMAPYNLSDDRTASEGRNDETLSNRT
jgi:hypothetical protein